MPNKRINKGSVEEENSILWTEEQIKEYAVVLPMMESMLDEIKTISTKKHDAKLSILKVKMINRLIVTSRELLASQPVLEYLEEIDEHNLPEYSDVSIILRQYIEALKQFDLQNQDSVNEFVKGFDLSNLCEDDLKQLEEILSKARSIPSE